MNGRERADEDRVAIGAFLDALVGDAVAGDTVEGDTVAGLDVEPGGVVRTRRGGVVSLVVDPPPAAATAALRVATHRGIPTVVVLTDATPSSVSGALGSGWPNGVAGRGVADRSVAGRSGPTVAVLLGRATAPPPSWSSVGPDVVVALAGSTAAATDLVDEVVTDAHHAATVVERLLAIVGGSAADAVVGAEPPRDLTHSVPFAIDGPYPIEAVLERVLDGGELVALNRPPAAELVTGLATIDGWPVGVMATRAEHRGGRLGTAAFRRVARFVDLLSRIDLPLVVLADSAGEDWDDEPATLAAMRDALVAQRDADVPEYVVVLGRAIGVAAAVLGVIGVGVDHVMAWPRAELASVPWRDSIRGAQGEDPDAAGVELAAPDGADRTDTVRVGPTSVLAAARAGTILDIVAPDDTRRRLAELLALDPGRARAVDPPEPGR